MEIEENTILVVSHDDKWEKSIENICSSLKGEKRRSWFTPHTYLCLPLVIGNQYGFMIRSQFKFWAMWNGGETPDDVMVMCHPNDDSQKVESHFGMGTITVTNHFHFRTPPGVNLMTINPPNYFIDGLQHMTGVVETDNLRRDFTFNLKFTRPNHPVHIDVGQPIGCFLPIPRYFVDNFDLKSATEVWTDEEIADERKIAFEDGDARMGPDKEKPHECGRRYRNGVDVRGNKFPDHQTNMDNKSV